MRYQIAVSTLSIEPDGFYYNSGIGRRYLNNIFFLATVTENMAYQISKRCFLYYAY